MKGKILVVYASKYGETKEIAYAYEQGTKQRRAPKFLATD